MCSACKKWSIYPVNILISYNYEKLQQKRNKTQKNDNHSDSHGSEIRLQKTNLVDTHIAPKFIFRCRARAQNSILPCTVIHLVAMHTIHRNQLMCNPKATQFKKSRSTYQRKNKPVLAEGFGSNFKLNLSFL